MLMLEDAGAASGDLVLWKMTMGKVSFTFSYTH